MALQSSYKCCSMWHWSMLSICTYEDKHQINRNEEVEKANTHRVLNKITGKEGEN